MTAPARAASLLLWAALHLMGLRLSVGFVSIRSIAHRQHQTAHSSSNNDAHDTGAAVNQDGGASDDSTSEGPEPPQGKPMSRLAMAAADWMEEEDDELAAYWDRFDAAKAAARQDDGEPKATPMVRLADDGDGGGGAEAMSTGERLDRYLASRGIDRALERKHEGEIREALEHATKSATSAADAVRALERVRPYLRPGSRLGGTALLELASALYAAGDGDEEGEAGEICEEVFRASSQRDLKARARGLREDPGRFGREYGKQGGFWGAFNGWWS